MLPSHVRFIYAAALRAAGRPRSLIATDFAVVLYEQGAPAGSGQSLTRWCPWSRWETR